MELVEEGIHFERGEWKEIERFQCLICPWDTLAGRDVIIGHVARVHLAKPAPALVDTPILDRFGNPVQRPAAEQEEDADLEVIDDA